MNEVHRSTLSPSHSLFPSSQASTPEAPAAFSFPPLWSGENTSDHCVTSSSDDERSFLDPSIDDRTRRTTSRAKTIGHQEPFYDCFQESRGMLRSVSYDVAPPPLASPTSLSSGFSQVNRQEVDQPSHVAASHVEQQRACSWSNFNRIRTIHEDKILQQPLEGSPSSFCLDQPGTVEDCLANQSCAVASMEAKNPNESCTKSPRTPASTPGQAPSSTLPRSTTSDIHEDLELRILNERLKLLSSQRQLAAMKCQQFTQMLEASLARQSSVANSTVNSGMNSGVPASPASGSMFLVEDDEQYWSSPNFYRGKYRASHMPPPSAALKAPIVEGCRLPHDTYFLDNRQRRRRTRPPNRHSRRLTTANLGSSVSPS